MRGVTSNAYDVSTFNSALHLLFVSSSAIVRDSTEANLHVDAVIDPLSATGQKITPLLVLLQDWLQLSVRIVLNPMVRSVTERRVYLLFHAT